MTHTKDEALKLAREALEAITIKGRVPPTGIAFSKAKAAFAACEQALAAPVQEPAGDWRDNCAVGQEALLRYRAVQPEPVAHQYWCASLTRLLLSNPPQRAHCDCKPPAAQPAPVPMAHIVGEIDHTGKVWKPVQPAIPDAIHHTDMSKTLEYIQGWNACRQATLEMMK